MKTLLIIAATAAITWITTNVIYGMRASVERLWMISEVKVPGQLAIKDIQSDLNAGRFETAKAKVDAFVATWQQFNSGPDSCSGPGIGNVMVAFSNIETNQPSSTTDSPR
jgi:hypothetical protein